MKFGFQGKSGDAKQKAAARAAQSGPVEPAKQDASAPKQLAAPTVEARGTESAPRTSGLRIPGKAAPQQAPLVQPEKYDNVNPSKSALQVPTAKSAPIIEAVAVHLPATEQTGIEYPTQVRNVPAEIVEDFNTSRKLLQNCLTENTQMIGHALRRVMVDMKLHPELGDILLPEDMGNMVRALRESYGQTIAIKEKKRKKPKDKPAGDKITASKLFDMLVDI